MWTSPIVRLWVAIVLAVLMPRGTVAADDICPPVAAPGGYDFNLPCVPEPTIHEGLAGQLYFESTSTALTAEARMILDNQAAYLLANPNLKIDLIGLADSREAPTTIERLELGGNRAVAARAYLIGRGADAARINAKGHGDIALIPKRLDEQTFAAMRFVYAKEQGR